MKPFVVHTTRAKRVGRPFRRCSACVRVWPSRNAFLSDPDVTLVGYQVNYGELKAGFFLFNHACRTTLAVRASTFRNLYDGPIFRQRADGTASCPGYCVHESELAACPSACECAYVREILRVCRDWPKRPRR